MNNIDILNLCTCFQKNPELQIDDLQDIDLCDRECPIHGVGACIVEE